MMFDSPFDSPVPANSLFYVEIYVNDLVFVSTVVISTHSSSDEDNGSINNKVSGWAYTTHAHIL